MKTIKENDVKFVDLRFTDPKGKEQHVTLPASAVDESLFTNGKMFDGSSIAGWKAINESDMILMPDQDTAIMDPFFSDSTLTVRCNVLETSGEGYARDPRSIAIRAEKYLQDSGIADTAYFGPGFLATLQLASLMKKETYIERFYLDIDQEFYPNFKRALNGKYKLPSGPGLGIDLDYNKLSKYEI